MRKHLPLILFLFLFFFTAISRPVGVFADSSNERLPAGIIIESDYFRSGQTIQIDGEIHGDAFLVGGVVTVNGRIDGDLFVLAGKVSVNGEITQNIRILAGDVVINSSVGRNVLLFCGNCALTKQASVGGSVLTTGANLEMAAAKVGKGFRFFGNRLFVNSEIKNEAFVVADQEFLLGPQASISGNLKYSGSKEVQMEQGATVAGNIAYENTSKTENYPRFFGARTIFSWGQKLQPLTNLFGFVVSSIVGFVMLGLFSRWFEKISNAVDREPYASLGWGIVLVTALPVMSFLFAVTVVGIPVSLVLLLLGYILYIIASYVAAFFLGRKILLPKFGERRGWALVLGLFIFTLLSYVPVVGGVVKFVFVLFVLGGTFISYRHKSIWEMKSVYVKDERVLIEKGKKKKRNGSKA